MFVNFSMCSSSTICMYYPIDICFIHHLLYIYIHIIWFIYILSFKIYFQHTKSIRLHQSLHRYEFPELRFLQKRPNFTQFYTFPGRGHSRKACRTPKKESKPLAITKKCFLLQQPRTKLLIDSFFSNSTSLCSKNESLNSVKWLYIIRFHQITWHDFFFVKFIIKFIIKNFFQFSQIAWQDQIPSNVFTFFFFRLRIDWFFANSEAYCICSVMSSASNLNRRSRELGLFCHVPLKRNQQYRELRCRSL